MNTTWRILEGDCREVLRGLPEKSVHTVVTPSIPAMRRGRSLRHGSRWRFSIAKNMPYLILKRDQAAIVLEIERVRAAHSPGRSAPPGTARRVPAVAIAEMERLHGELRALKSNKRPIGCRP